VSNGVKQGAVLSPVLFNMYLDELIKCLTTSRFGCYIGNHFMGAFAYADDIVILAPTKWSLKEMLCITNKFSKEFDLIFNASKSQYLVVDNKGICNDSIMFNETQLISNEDNISHLGNFIGAKTGNDSIEKCIKDFTRQYNFIISNYYRCNSEVKYQLFKSYCMSLYGCPLWDLNDKGIDKFYVLW